MHKHRRTACRAVPYLILPYRIVPHRRVSFGTVPYDQPAGCWVWLLGACLTVLVLVLSAVVSGDLMTASAH